MYAVKDAAKYLDQQRSGWFNEIDVLKLNQNYADRCVLGQLFGSFYDEDAKKLMDDYGSSYPFGGEGIDDTKCWESEVIARRVGSVKPKTLTDDTRVATTYCVSQSDLAPVVKDSTYKELYSL